MGNKTTVTTPLLSLPRVGALRGPVAPRLAYPALLLGLSLALLGYAAVGVVLLRMALGLL